ncbi:DEAD/DEAH box helicase [Mucilaginibacter sp. cycad4]|uniref:DEAD/DEAH box helicase n=1 Tax=Mucilaginibacter sp. cycad4 TaxID=3342096 RepID=UPI002AAA657C|nr:DEAD/DEAH box helicase [Mucilaginibacter gossypii]WPU97875.1 DEAD/DEAH box helicase [Mucilaginibacter gossypii]
MTIDLDNSQIVIADPTDILGPIEKSQLSFWGFVFDNELKTYQKNLDQQTYLKTIQYFNNEEIGYELKDNANTYSQELDVLKSNFDLIKDTASRFKQGDYNYAHFDEFREFVTSNIQRSLKIHQLKAAYHLYILGNGANFSVPGSGKTTVVLTVYEKLRAEGKVNTLFVIGPPSSFGPWRNEFKETLGRKPKYVVLAGGVKNTRKKQYFNTPELTSELYLTSFHTSLYDKNEVNQFLNQSHVKAFLVVDEAHYIKQINGNWAQAILQQSQSAKFRCVLTGTPMPKSYTDIFNLFDFLWPNQHPIPSPDKTMIKINEERKDTLAAKELLEQYIGPLFYRVRKSDLNLKPQIFLQPDLVKMGKIERKIYDAIYNKIKDYAKAEYFKNVDIINKLGRGRIIRLRQAVSYPKLLNSAIEDYDEKIFEDLTDIKYLINQYDKIELPAKLKVLTSKVKVLQKKKQKVVIWSNFIGTLNLIEKHFLELGLNCKKIFGGTPVEDGTFKVEETREKIRDQFIDEHSGLDILIANPAACAESISLHKTCHHAIYYDLSYNCAQYLQSLDRIHRVGGSEFIEATYHFLQYENSVDIDIKANIDMKTIKMLEIIEEDYPIYSLDMFEPEEDSEAYKRLFL